MAVKKRFKAGYKIQIVRNTRYHGGLAVPVGTVLTVGNELDQEEAWDLVVAQKAVPVEDLEEDVPTEVETGKTSKKK